MEIISLDLWGTLMKASPSFKKAKCELIREFFNSKVQDVSIEYAFKVTKIHFDAIIESTGWQPTEEQILRVLFFYLFNMKYSEFDLNKAMSLYEKYQQLFIDNPPLLYSPDTKDCLQELVDNGKILRLSSNTMFIKGDTLSTVLSNLEILKYFKSTWYSDETSISKPNPLMFKGASFHIGDNVNTDIDGAKGAGVDSYLINSNHKTLKDAVNFILGKG